MSTVTYGSTPGRWILVATVLGSGMAMLDGTVVNVALPSIGKDLGAQVAGLQWVLTAYLITLSALILIGGSLGDRFGRRRVFLVGVAWFTVASVLCAAAPNLVVLIAARALQGVGGALLVPGSLAIIESSFSPDDRGRAIGMWSALGGVATAIGPLAGGWLVTAVSWRLIFVLNVPLAVAVVVAPRHVPESRDADAVPHIDGTGAALGRRRPGRADASRSSRGRLRRATSSGWCWPGSLASAAWSGSSSSSTGAGRRCCRSRSSRLASSRWPTS